nr:VOC family protein [Paenibacillus sacheonensis]
MKSSYLGIPVDNLESAVEWYGKHFGFKVIKVDPIFVELLTESGVRICLSKHDPAVNSHIDLPTGPFPVQGFIVSDAEAVYQELRDNGVLDSSLIIKGNHSRFVIQTETLSKYGVYRRVITR